MLHHFLSGKHNVAECWKGSYRLGTRKNWKELKEFELITSTERQQKNDAFLPLTLFLELNSDTSRH